MSKSNTQTTKSHPLEGDGCLINLFQHLWKKNANTLESCPGVSILTREFVTVF